MTLATFRPLRICYLQKLTSREYLGTVVSVHISHQLLLQRNS